MHNSHSLIRDLLQRSEVHQQWRPLLTAALQEVDSDYLQQLWQDNNWLPGKDRLFAAFQRDLENCRYILIGESPYPRAQSANGIAFFDAAVDQLWSGKGLSKAVNRATSLRNIIKTSLLAQGLIEPDADGKISQPSIAAIDKTGRVQTIAELFQRLNEQGFLMFNATPVLYPDNPVAREAVFWIDFLNRLLAELKALKTEPPSLVLWGKIARQIEQLPAASDYHKICSEHPYNLSFIDNPDMQQLFNQLQLL